MFVKKSDYLFPVLNHLFLLWIIFLLPFGLFGQTTADSYKNLWEVIQSDTVSNAKKIAYLEVYYQKARAESNQLEQYKALEKKSFLVSFADAALLLHQMHPLVQKMDNDSIKGRFLNRSTVFYYDNRDFKNALYYAIESEAFNEEINNLYNLNAARIDIGNIYLHTRHYNKAVAYFTQAKEYYQTKKDYNHLRGYVNTLYNLSRTYWQLHDIDLLTATINESQEAVVLLKPKHRQLETAYLEYLNGGLAFLQKNNATAQSYFTKALPAIQQNGDFTNEHVIYLYLGKIAWQQNQKAEAIQYFTKIDSLFHEKAFLNYELREAYDYLIAYYKETEQSALQNQATESLITLNQQFEKEQQSITDILHEELDTKKLKKSQVQLQKLVNKSTIWISVLGGVLLILAVYLFWKRFKNQNVDKNSTIKEKENVVEIADVVKNETTEVKEVANVSNSITEIIPEPQKEEQKREKQKKEELSSTEQRLLEGLTRFEKEKGFLESTTLDDLAKQLNTTRSTLSPFLNEHKSGFSTYVNKLRIQQVVTDLKADKELRKKSIKDLAALYGNLHPKTFASLFKVITGETPSLFIERLDQEDETLMS